MDLTLKLLLVCGVTLFLIFVLVCRRRAQFILNFIVRMVLGAVGIVFCNQLLESGQIAVSVGLNPTTLLTVGTLGISGFGLLYGIVFCKFL